jgi:hypothetical protein
MIGLIYLTYIFLFYDPWWLYLLKWRKWKKMKKEEMEGKWLIFKKKMNPKPIVRKINLKYQVKKSEFK